MMKLQCILGDTTSCACDATNGELVRAGNSEFIAPEYWWEGVTGDLSLLYDVTRDVTRGQMSVWREIGPPFTKSLFSLL